MEDLLALRLPVLPAAEDHHFTPEDIDIPRLEAELRADVRGEVRFSPGDRAIYSTDASNYRQVPIGVVLPRDKEDVARAVAICRRHGAPILPRGGGTSIPGQSCNVAVLIDFSKYMHDVLSIDPDRRRAHVQPGTVLDTLRARAEEHRLTFGPDPATHSRCTLGGMIGNNSCGIHSVMAGRTSDNVERLEVLTHDGLRMWVGPTDDAEYDRILAAGGRRAEIYRALRDLRDRYADLIRERYPRIPRRVSGYNLIDLLPENGFNVARALVGSEGTCVTVLEAELRLVESPPARSLLVLGFPDIFAAADHVPLARGFGAIGLEGLDSEFIEDMKLKGLHPRNLDLMPAGHGWILAEFGGASKEESDERARVLMRAAETWDTPPTMKLFDDPAQERLIWGLREEGLGATAHVPGKKENHEGWEDAAVDPERVGPYLREFGRLMERYDYHGSLYGHFGDGCVHTRLDFDLRTDDGVRAYRSFVEEAAALVVAHGGSLSGEHGDGQARGELLVEMYGPELIEAFREFKAIWDPAWKMNPGKLVEPYRLDSNLRLGPSYRPPDPTTHFSFSGDGFSFARAAERCVGAGVCRRHDGGTMCPSYQVTLEEKHSTRGRARLLFEMLEGDPIRDGWRSEEVREALDLCLACKGCKSECPVQVDMATYKAEFLSHYYEGRLRPRGAYAMGLIHLWARLASRAPRLANFLTQAPGLRTIARLIAGIHPHRRLPRFADEPFTRWLDRRGHRSDAPWLAGPAGIAPGEDVSRRDAGETDDRPRRVILWADTFNNYFLPETPRAALAVLEGAGFSVTVPTGGLCCGRPLYDWGMLDRARGLLERVLAALEPEILRGTPVVVLEPSCAAVFRDELPNLMHGNDLAKRLAGQTFLLSEFLATFAPDFRAGELDGAAILHGHCHHRAIAGIDGEEALLRTTKLDVSIPDSGCCGMAGAFGFEREHYDLSVAVGNRALLPAVRAADRGTMIVADGFSCREQIAQETGRRALHVAEVLALAMQRENLMQNDAPIPVEQERTHVPGPNLVPLVAAAVAVAAGGLLYAWGRRAISSRRMELDGLPREHGLSERYVLEDLWTNTAR